MADEKQTKCKVNDSLLGYRHLGVNKRLSFFRNFEGK